LTVRRFLLGCAAVAALVAPATAHAGSFPGTNGKIAFESDRDGYQGIRVMNPDGSGVTNLFSPSSFHSAWSADGTKIAFGSNRDGNDEIYVMDADGSNQQRLTNNTAADFEPSWSPDGQHIAFVSDRDGNEEIYVMNADGTGQVNVTRNAAHDAEPAWSPLGNRIAFDTLRDGGELEIYLMDPDGSNLVNLTNNSDFDGVGSWSPDGTRIVFNTARDGTVEIYTMGADGSNPVRLTNDLRPEITPAWSPDGTRIVFAGLTPNVEIFTMSASGGDEVRLTSNPAFDSNPDWQPIPLPNQPPDCSGVTADRPLLRPPNHQFRLVGLRGASDPDGDPVTLQITAVTQDEPVRTATDKKAPDARVTSSPSKVRLRAERDPQSDGRVYRIEFTASDGQGGQCDGTTAVEVPRLPGRPAVDSAPPSYDSFGH
jgi:dipeptidyl aminopeptidase/acylaminoacyl peptidase